jgi:hypothetical protein
VSTRRMRAPPSAALHPDWMADPAQASLPVADAGPGIAAADLPRSPDLGQAPAADERLPAPRIAPDDSAGEGIRGVIAYSTKPLDLTELGELLDSVAAEDDRRPGPASLTGPLP